jgi:hypothetical protein
VPTKSEGLVSLVCAETAFAETALVDEAAREGKHRMPAPAINIKQARSPGNFPGTAPDFNRVTGSSLCMKNTAFDALVAASWVRLSLGLAPSGSGSFRVWLVRKHVFVQSFTSLHASYVVWRWQSVTSITRDRRPIPRPCLGLPRLCFSQIPLLCRGQVDFSISGPYAQPQTEHLCSGKDEAELPEC